MLQREEPALEQSAFDAICCGRAETIAEQNMSVLAPRRFLSRREADQRLLTASVVLAVMSICGAVGFGAGDVGQAWITLG